MSAFRQHVNVCPPTEMRRCRVCLEDKDDCCFDRHHCAPKSGYKRICRQCKAQQKAVLYRLKCQHVKPALGAACEICGTHTERLCLDHDHSTQKLRGFLCANCNKGIGMLKEDPAILGRAIEYLSR